MLKKLLLSLLILSPNLYAAANKDTPLHKAARSGDVEEVRKLILAGANVNAPGYWYDETPLAHAASYGVSADKFDTKAECARLLLEAGATVDARDTLRSSTPLHNAVVQENIPVIDVLLAHRADINAQDKDGQTPFMIAAMGRAKIVAHLRQKGAREDLQDTARKTALHLAMQGGHMALVEDLLKNGADVNTQDAQGCTILHYALALGEVDFARTLLTKYGADATLKMRNGSSVFDCTMNAAQFVKPDGRIDDAMHDKKQKVSPEKFRAGLEMLIDHGVDISMPGKHTYSPLKRALMLKNSAYAHLLLSRGAPINDEIKSSLTTDHTTAPLAKPILEKLIADNDVAFIDTRGNNLLHGAAQRGDAEMLDNLLKACPAGLINAQNNDDYSPLHYAADKKHPSCVQLLLDRGADAKLTTKRSETALHFAAQKGDATSIQALIQADTPLEIVTKPNQEPSHYPNVGRIHDGKTALHYAAENGDDASIQALVDAGANKEARDPYGKTPLFHAATRGYGQQHFNGPTSTGVQILLRAGADPHAQNSSGYTAMHSAIWQNNAAVVKDLLQAGVNPNLVDKQQRTLLDWSISSDPLLRNTSCFEALLDGGADINMPSGVDTSKTLRQAPILIAADRSNTRAIELLADRGADLSATDDRRQTAQDILKRKTFSEETILDRWHAKKAAAARQQAEQERLTREQEERAQKEAEAQRLAAEQAAAAQAQQRQQAAQTPPPTPNSTASKPATPSTQTSTQTAPQTGGSPAPSSTSTQPPAGNASTSQPTSTTPTPAQTSQGSTQQKSTLEKSFLRAWGGKGLIFGGLVGSGISLWSVLNRAQFFVDQKIYCINKSRAESRQKPIELEGSAYVKAVVKKAVRLITRKERGKAAALAASLTALVSGVLLEVTQ